MKRRHRNRWLRHLGWLGWLRNDRTHPGTNPETLFSAWDRRGDERGRASLNRGDVWGA